ncbi:hypothetical protein KBD68_00545 [Candidatus Woesebacteria bacterium]|jgi:hypothetical protein|nr:hypothetical protein [Candidatus Woesebacteria bacterium]
MKKVSSTRVMIKIYVTNIINIGLLIAIFVFVGKLSVLATDVQKKHSEVIALEQRAEDKVLAANLEKTKSTVDLLKSSFLDEAGIVSFVQKIEELKKSGVITDMSFPSTQPVSDGSRGRGLPLLVKIEGTKEAVNAGVTALNTLPAILRPVSVKITKEVAAYKMEYGVFVYVK